MNELSICSGVGALSLGLELAIGDAFTPIGFVEREISSAEVLARRMEEGSLKKCPIFSDLSTFDGKPYRGKVDILTAALPCQPYSVAGRMAGHADERALWPEFVRIARECEPALIFLENVPGFRKQFGPVWREFRELGFVWASPLLQTASESGAPHIRERFFALAAHSERIDLRQQLWRGGGPNGCRQAVTGYDGATHPHTDIARLEGWRLQERQCSDKRSARPLGGPDANAERIGCKGVGGGWLFDGERETLRHDAHRCGDGCRVCGTYWEAESPILKLVDESADWLDGGLDEFEGMLAVRHEISREEVRARIRGSMGGEEILLVDLLKHEGRPSDPRWVRQAREEISRAFLRDLQRCGASLHPSHRQRLGEQRTTEFDDALQFVSHAVTSRGGGNVSGRRGEAAMLALRKTVLQAGALLDSSESLVEAWRRLPCEDKAGLILGACFKAVSEFRADELRAIGNVGAPPVAYARAYITLADNLYNNNIEGD